MSNKEYEIDYNEYTGKYTVTEKEPYDNSHTPSTTPTWREKLGEKMYTLPRGSKLFLAFIGIYGFLYRLGSNSTFSVIISCLQYCTFNFFGLLWIIDIISVIVKNDIVLFGRVNHKDYEPRNRY